VKQFAGERTKDLVVQKTAVTDLRKEHEKRTEITLDLVV
jgi:hypothetical protein